MHGFGTALPQSRHGKGAAEAQVSCDGTFRG